MAPEVTTARGRAVVRARAQDVPGIVSLEAAPEMARYIGHWSGLAIITEYPPRFRWYELARFVVARPGEGRGSDVLVPIIDFMFERLNAHRIQLDAYVDNTRAIRAYERVGFRREGVRRSAVTRDGAWVDLVLMALLENERTVVAVQRP